MGNPEDWWSPRSTIDATVDIDTGLHSYYVLDLADRIVPIRVIHSSAGPHLEASTPGGKSIPIACPTFDATYRLLLACACDSPVSGWRRGSESTPAC